MQREETGEQEGGYGKPKGKGVSAAGFPPGGEKGVSGVGTGCWGVRWGHPGEGAASERTPRVKREMCESSSACQ